MAELKRYIKMAELKLCATKKGYTQTFLKTKEKDLKERIFVVSKGSFSCDPMIRQPPVEREATNFLKARCFNSSL